MRPTVTVNDDADYGELPTVKESTYLVRYQDDTLRSCLPPGVYELVPVGSSLADDPAAVERAAKELVETWLDPTIDDAAITDSDRAVVRRVLRAAEGTNE